MRIQPFLVTKITLVFVMVSLLPNGCTKEDDSYLVNNEVLLPANAFKTKLKTDQQYAAILHANLFQQALSANELYDIAQCIESIGDKEVAREVLNAEKKQVFMFVFVDIHVVELKSKQGNTPFSYLIQLL